VRVTLEPSLHERLPTPSFFVGSTLCSGHTELSPLPDTRSQFSFTVVSRLTPARLPQDPLGAGSGFSELCIVEFFLEVAFFFFSASECMAIFFRPVPSHRRYSLSFNLIFLFLRRFLGGCGSTLERVEVSSACLTFLRNDLWTYIQSSVFPFPGPALFCPPPGFFLRICRLTKSLDRVCPFTLPVPFFPRGPGFFRVDGRWRLPRSPVIGFPARFGAAVFFWGSDQFCGTDCLRPLIFQCCFMRLPMLLAAALLFFPHLPFCSFCF